MIVDPKIKGYDFSQLNDILTGTGLEIKNIYDYYKNLYTIKDKLDQLDTDNYGYLYAPLKEPYFEIDANTRTIKVPDAFRTNGIGVQGDNLAETICFSINRYFDTMDLARTKVFINWTLNDGEETAKEEAFFIDPIAKADYLIIGWPLDGKKFTNIGKLKFYLTFEIVEDDVEVYRLNTLSAEVKINNTLQLDANTEVINKESYEESYGVLFANSDNYTKYEIGATPTLTLVKDLQIKKDDLDVNISGPRKELITGNSLDLAAQFNIPNDVEVEVYLYKDGVKQNGQIPPQEDGIYKVTVNTPGAYQLQATPFQTVAGLSAPKTGLTVKTSVITFMKPLTPLYEIECTNHLPTSVSAEKDKNIIYLPENGEYADVKITITGLDYSTDNSGFAHSKNDFGIFKLVLTTNTIEDENITTATEKFAFADKELILTSDILDKIKTILTNASGTVNLQHELNGGAPAVIENIFANYDFITTTVAPFVITSPALGKIILNKDRNFFTLSKGNFSSGTEAYTETAIWQKSKTSSNGRITWETEFYQEDPILITLSGLDPQKTYYEKNRASLENAVKSNYRICLVRTDGYTTTSSIVSPTHDFDQFYTIDVSALITAEPQE